MKKLVVVGDARCGKSCLVNTLVHPNHKLTEADTCQYTPTVFVNDEILYTSKDGSSIRLAVSDTSGQEDYDRLRPLSYLDASVVLLCFGIESPESLRSISGKWLTEIRHLLPDVPILLVGLKKDLRHDPKVCSRLSKSGLEPVKPEEGRVLAWRIGAESYVECSAFDRSGIQEVLEQAVQLAINTKITVKWKQAAKLVKI